MTEKELLGLAAKAAGITGTRTGTTGGPYFLDERVMLHREWNPLRNDADAFWLAIKLDIVARVINRIAFAWVDGVCDIQEPVNGDACAAIRRAIVRAAAEIGKAQKFSLVETKT